MMRQDEELWMKKMKDTLSAYSEPPAPDGWSRLEKELAPMAVKRIRPYTWWVAAAVMLLALSGISILFMQTPTADDIRHTAPPVLAVAEEVEAAPKVDVVTDTNEPEELVARVETIIEPTITNPDAHGVISREIEAVVPTTDIVIDEPKAEPKTEPEPEVKATDTPSDDRQVVRPSGKDKLHLPVVTKNKRSSDGQWSVAASFSNAAGALTNETRDYLVMADAVLSSDALSSGMVLIGNGEQLVFDGGIPYLKQNAIISEVKHKQPISFGLSVRKNLTNGFSVETGVTYTMLSSEGKSVSNPSNQIDQKLHYVGIPLRGNWEFVDSKRFTVYLTAGGMVEKCVYGKIGSEKHTVKPLQLSLLGGIGGQLNISDRVGLYIEPGVSYFFDDGSDIETIRKENPLNFNLQGGIRFTY